MLINVKMLNGSNFPIEVMGENTIGDLKQKLVEKCGWPPEDQKLIFLGRVLPDDQTCGSANLQDGTALHLVHKPRPVDPPENRDHPMDEDEAPDYRHEPHVHAFDTGANSFSFNAVPTHVDPIQRLQTLTRIAERLETQRIPSFETALAQRDGLDNLEIFQQEPWDMHMHESSCDEEDHLPARVDPTPRRDEAPLPQAHAPGNIDNEIGELHPPSTLRIYRNVMLQTLGLTNNILRVADILSQAAVSHKDFTPNGARAFQTGFDSLNVTLHELAHLFHGLSDINLDFQKPAHERALTIAPRLEVEHRALLQTAITIPMNGIGAPRIGEMIAQQLGQQVAGLGEIPFLALGGLGPLNQNPSPNQQSPNVAQSGTAPAPPTANANPTAPRPPTDARDSDQAEVDPLRTISQIIANHVSAIVGQDTNSPRRENGAAASNSSDLTKVLPCSSTLNRSYNTPTPALAPHSVGYFESKFVSPMQFANDMLSFAAHPLALQLIKYIHGDLERPDQAREIEDLLAKRFARRLIFKDGRSVVHRMKYTPDGRNFKSPTQDLETSFQEKIIACLRSIKVGLCSVSYHLRNFGLLEIFQVIAPPLMEDLKCFFGNNHWEGRWYIRCLLEDIFPTPSYASKLMLEDELLKCYDKADSTQSKYHGKIKVVSITPLPHVLLDPEDLDEEYYD